MSDPDTNSEQSRRVGPWLRKNRTLRYENPWIAIYHDEVRTPGDTDGIYGVVHFKGHAVGVVPIDEAGNTWLVGQYRYTLDAFSWEIPEGGAHAGEDTLACAHRELAEETGLRATTMRELQRLHTSNSITDERAVLYVASGLTEGAQALESTEDIRLWKLPLQEAIAMVLRGEITDAMSVAALLRLGLTSDV